MRRQRPDVIHAPYFLRPYRAPAPVVLTVYDLIPLVLPQDYSRRERFIFRVGMRLSLRTARLALAISQATADDFVHVFGTARSRLRVTPLAPGAAFRPQSQQAIDATRQRLHLDGEYVLYLGSNKPHKNLSSLTDAWAQIAAGHPDVTLAIAGHWDPRFPQAREEVAAAGLERRVRFVGSVAPDDLPALYSGARLFCFPSLYEGFGLPVLEAMACGTPVVCSDASSLPEVAGDAALLVDPHDAEALAAALHRVLSDAALRDDLAERSLARAGAFSWARTARQTLRAYREVAR
jgi:alpha-1,3-rhamnosyl/mannosyltransferase